MLRNTAVALEFCKQNFFVLDGTCKAGLELADIIVFMGRIGMDLCELKRKEVINICDGKRLGFVTDLEFDMETGCIRAIIVPGPCRLWGILGREQDYRFPFENIRSVGPDVILIDVDLEKCLQHTHF